MREAADSSANDANFRLGEPHRLFLRSAVSLFHALESWASPYQSLLLSWFPS